MTRFEDLSKVTVSKIYHNVPQTMFKGTVLPVIGSFNVVLR